MYLFLAVCLSAPCRCISDDLGVVLTSKIKKNLNRRIRRSFDFRGFLRFRSCVKNLAICLNDLKGMISS